MCVLGAVVHMCGSTVCVCVCVTGLNSLTEASGCSMEIKCVFVCLCGDVQYSMNVRLM